MNLYRNIFKPLADFLSAFVLLVILSPIIVCSGLLLLLANRGKVCFFQQRPGLKARHGALKKHEHQIEGVNSRLDGLQAAILSAKLPHILEWTAARIKCADTYDQLLSGISSIVTPKRRENTRHSYHLYVIRAENRDVLAQHLKVCNIETAIHYPTALPNLKAYTYLGHGSYDFPVATAYQSQILSLPIYPELTRSQMEYVADCIKSFYSK